MDGWELDERLTWSGTTAELILQRHITSVDVER